MKTALISVVLLLALSSHALAILRPRYPVRPTPPFTGQVIIIGEDSIQKPAQKAPQATAR